MTLDVGRPETTSLLRLITRSTRYTYVGHSKRLCPLSPHYILIFVSNARLVLTIRWWLMALLLQPSAKAFRKAGFQIEISTTSDHASSRVAQHLVRNNRTRLRKEEKFGTTVCYYLYTFIVEYTMVQHNSMSTKEEERRLLIFAGPWSFASELREIQYTLYVLTLLFSSNSMEHVSSPQNDLMKLHAGHTTLRP